MARSDGVVEHLLGVDAAEPTLATSVRDVVEVFAGDVVLERLSSEVQPTEQTRDRLRQHLPGTHFHISRGRIHACDSCLST